MPQDFFQLKWELHFLPVRSLAPRVSQRGIPLSLEGNSLPVMGSIKPQSGANYLQGQSGTGSWVLRAEKEEKVNWLLAVSNFNLICTCRAPCKTQMNLPGGPIYLGIQRYREEVNPLRSCQRHPDEAEVLCPCLFIVWDWGPVSAMHFPHTRTPSLMETPKFFYPWAVASCRHILGIFYVNISLR